MRLAESIFFSVFFSVLFPFSVMHPHRHIPPSLPLSPSLPLPSSLPLALAFLGDAASTWHLRERLEVELKRWPWTAGLTMFDFYLRYWLAFGECLTDMEREGIYVRKDDYLPSIQRKAVVDMKEAEKSFLAWAQKQRPEAKYMNPCSEIQKSQFFFAPPSQAQGDIYDSRLPLTREFDTENTFNYVEPGKAKAKKKFTFELGGLGMPVVSRTPKGSPQAGMPVLKELAGDLDKKPPRYGTAYEFFGGGDKGREACEAINALVKVSAVEIMLSTFIEPLGMLIIIA